MFDEQKIHLKTSILTNVFAPRRKNFVPLQGLQSEADETLCSQSLYD